MLNPRKGVEQPVKKGWRQFVIRADQGLSSRKKSPLPEPTQQDGWREQERPVPPARQFVTGLDQFRRQSTQGHAFADIKTQIVYSFELITGRHIQDNLATANEQTAPGFQCLDTFFVWQVIQNVVADKHGNGTRGEAPLQFTDRTQLHGNAALLATLDGVRRQVKAAGAESGRSKPE